MDKFDEAAELVMFVTAIAAETSTEEEKERSDSLAATIEDMGCDSIDESNRGVEVSADLILDAIKLMAVSIPHIRHAMNC